MKIVLLVCVFLGVLISPTAFAQVTPEIPVTDSTAVEVEEPELPPAVTFRTGDFESVLREARRTRKPILLDFWADWCKPCHRLDRESFSNQQVGDYINARYIPYRINIEDFVGMDLVDKFAVKVFPTMLVVNSTDQRILQTLTGFFPPTYLVRELEKYRPPTASRR